MGRQRLRKPAVVLPERRGVAEPVAHLEDAHRLLAAGQGHEQRIANLFGGQQRIVTAARKQHGTSGMGADGEVGALAFSGNRLTTFAALVIGEAQQRGDVRRWIPKPQHRAVGGQQAGGVAQQQADELAAAGRPDDPLGERIDLAQRRVAA